MPAPTITELLVGKTPAERAIIKAEQLVARIGGHLPYDYCRGEPCPTPYPRSSTA